MIPTATLLLLSLVSDDFVTSAFHISPAAFKILNAAVAVFAFIMVLIQMVWRPDSRSKAHRHAVEHYTNAKFATRRLGKLRSVAVRLDMIAAPMISSRGTRALGFDRKVASCTWAIVWFGRRGAVKTSSSIARHR